MAASHTTVVMTTVKSRFLANWFGSEAGKGLANFSVMETTAAVAMAEISDQALMRHQYQRSRYTAPVPAPMLTTISQPPATVCMT